MTTTTSNNDATLHAPSDPTLRQRSPGRTAASDGDAATREDEPLLGGPGDAVQPRAAPLWKNLVGGTGALAQIGALLAVALVWGAVLRKPVILFSAHPLLNSAGLLLATQAILLLQPTSTASQKAAGLYGHSALNAAAAASLFAAAAVIFYNKAAHAGVHFESPHAILGLATYALLAAQVLVGASAAYAPALYGSVTRAKSLYKYHRASGYLALVMMFAAVALATQTDYNVNVLGIRLWAVLVVAGVTLAGVLPRVRLSKMGLKR